MEFFRVIPSVILKLLAFSGRFLYHVSPWNTVNLPVPENSVIVVILLMLISSLCFTSMAALIKSLGTNIPLEEMVFLRCLLATPIMLAIVLSQGRPLLVRARKILIIRTLFGMSAMYCFFYALTHMPLADCTFITRTQPLLIALLAPFILKEKAPRAAWFATGTGLAGVFLVMKPAIAWQDGALAAVAAAFLSAGAHLMVRKLNRTDHPLVIVLNFTVLTACITGIASFTSFVFLSGGEWLAIAGVAVLASLGQVFMTSAYRFDRAPAVAAAGYGSVVFSILYGYIFWGENPEPAAWLGGGIIVLGGMLLIRSRWHIVEHAEKG